MGTQELRVGVGTGWGSGAKMLIPNRTLVSKKKRRQSFFEKEFGRSV